MRPDTTIYLREEFAMSFKVYTSITKSTLTSVNNTIPKRIKFLLDRDQIFYSNAFRRLAGKAQVFVTGQDEELRNRLTHTLEVSQIARTIAQSLNLNVDLVEAIALGHDLGHTPFGHVGERTLHEIMTPSPIHVLGSKCPLCIDPNKLPGELEQFLGFKHNLHSLVVAMETEKSCGDAGLNLTPYTLYGLQAHSKSQYSKKQMKNHDMLCYYEKYLKSGCMVSGKWAWSLEAFLVAEADEIAQWHHDMEDALKGSLITPAELKELLKNCNIDVTKAYSFSSEEKLVWNKPELFNPDLFTALFCRSMVLYLTQELIKCAAEGIRKAGDMDTVTFSGNLHGGDEIVCNTKKANRPVLSQENELKLQESLEEIARKEKTPVSKERVEAEREKARIAQAKDIFSYGDSDVKDSLAEGVEKFSKEIISRVLSSCQIQRADAKGRYIIRKIFQAYYATPQQLPDDCVYSFYVHYHALENEPHLKNQLRHPLQDKTELQLRERANKKGVGSIRRDFMNLFQCRDQTSQLEEVLLMRTICSYIASMTDAQAEKAYQELYG